MTPNREVRLVHRPFALSHFLQQSLILPQTDLRTSRLRCFHMSAINAEDCSIGGRTSDQLGDGLLCCNHLVRHVVGDATQPKALQDSNQFHMVSSIYLSMSKTIPD